MGTLFELYNFTLKQRTDVGIYSVNTKDWTESPLANFYVFMVRNFWADHHDIQLIGDSSGSWESLNEEFKDITTEAVKEYNEIASQYLEYYGKNDIPKIITVEQSRLEDET